MTGQEIGKVLLRGIVRIVYLVLLGGTGGVIYGMLGFTEGISPVILIGILILYNSTIDGLFTKLGIAKAVPAASEKNAN
jgi:hypothetical protein